MSNENTPTNLHVAVTNVMSHSGTCFKLLAFHNACREIDRRYIGPWRSQDHRVGGALHPDRPASGLGYAVIISVATIKVIEAATQAVHIHQNSFMTATFALG
jgi:hypothetical protein